MNIDRFRFRYWDNDFKKMGAVLEVSHIEYLGGDQISLYAIVDGYSRHASIYKPEHEKFLMQCTGLRDKHGTLIYESDVLHIGINHRTMPPSHMHEVVKFNNDISSCGCCFGDLRAVGLSIDYASGDNSEEWEIVGHIFQPEWEHLR